MRDHLLAFGRHLADRRSPRTQVTYATVLASFVDFMAEHRRGADVPARADVEAFLARPRRDGGRRSPAGRNQELAALRAFCRFAARDLGWTTNPTEGLPFLREPPRDPAILTVFELRRLFATAASAPGPGRARGLAMLGLLSQTGLRVHELVALDVDQVDLASATLVAVKGKGGTVHDVPLNAATVGLLVAWLVDREDRAEGGEPALFVSSQGARLSVRAVQRFVIALRDALGTKKKITPHTFRHSVATQLLTLGVDVSTVGDVLRHADLNVTRRYLHLVAERQRDAVNRLAVILPPGLRPETGPGDSSDPATLQSKTRPSVDFQDGLDDVA